MVTGRYESFPQSSLLMHLILTWRHCCCSSLLLEQNQLISTSSSPPVPDLTSSAAAQVHTHPVTQHSTTATSIGTTRQDRWERSVSKAEDYRTAQGSEWSECWQTLGSLPVLSAVGRRIMFCWWKPGPSLLWMLSIFCDMAQPLLSY